MKVNDDGFYSLMIGASDMGTGCDTILAQMAADCMDCEMEDIIVSGVDTDTSPYDTGSYASSTTYVTGMAVVKTCEKLKEKILLKGAEYLGCRTEDAEFDGKRVWCPKDGKEISLKDIGNRVMCANEEALMASEAHYSPTSPPPFMVGMAEVEVDVETGKVTPIDYVAVVDCGTVVNPSLARVQTEGESSRESEWRSMRILSTMNREGISVIRLCSTRFRPDRIPEKSGWNLKAAMNRPGRLARSPSERLSSIHRHRLLWLR